RKILWDRYMSHLAAWASENGVRLPIVPADCEQTYHIFYLLLSDANTRQALIAHLKSRGILAVFHYVPLHLSEMGMRLGGYAGQCPVTERVSDQLLRLPLYSGLSLSEQDQVIGALKDLTRYIEVIAVTDR